MAAHPAALIGVMVAAFVLSGCSGETGSGGRAPDVKPASSGTGATGSVKASAGADSAPRESLGMKNEPSAAGSGSRAQAVLAGGCFWCVEAVFEELEGVYDAESGYAGGDEATANYKAVSNGNTKHAEAVRIIYDPGVITYHDLLKVHFATHDPTTLNRQGADSGPQYRSAIFYANEAEHQEAQAFIAELQSAKAFGKPIVTTLEPLKAFYKAEAYHQNYVCDNPNNPYVSGVAWPKVKKVREKFGDKLKETSPLEQPGR